MKNRLVAICALVLGTCMSQAFAISEHEYEDAYRSQVTPYFNSGEVLTFKGKDGVSINAWRMIQPNERGALVILPGQGEPLLKYAEVAYDLRSLGFSIYMMDHRGQGASGRMTANPKVQYVKEFGDYADDLETFVNQIVNQVPHTKRFLLAHSMGGAISSLYLERHPDAFDAAVLNSPMEMINSDPYPEHVAIAIASAATHLGKGEAYSIGQSAFDATLPYTESRMARCEARHKMKVELFSQNPSLVIDGVSFRWVQKSLEEGIKIRRNADKITTPILLFQAGNDVIVKLDGQDEFCKRTKNCRIAFFPTARHEILMENDAIRDRAFSLIQEFFTAQN
ncbi:MAG: alpha/beta fold hydrolase [Bdellovibrionia bacterium]